MKTILRGIVFIAAGCATAPSLAPAPADALAPSGTADPTNSAVTMFYDSLAPYGDWLWVEPYMAATTFSPRHARPVAATVTAWMGQGRGRFRILRFS